MKKEVFGTCPVCGGSLLCTKLSCHTCNTEITGEFALSRFSYLSKEELYFVETFVRVQGNIKEMERELEISYPTVKKSLDSIVAKMGFSVPKPKINEDEVLAKIKSGEMSVEEALAFIKK
ncbi:MAG: DUF2089 domain-containing protein [Erysipelotrichia bacterium]|jgi:hypothetical protein|nr:DUF2089 domain-containing protein [Erysipelotrichia bacterium]